MTNIDPRFAAAHYEHDLDVSKAADAHIAKTANQIRTDEAVLGIAKQVDVMLDEMMTNARLHLGGEFKTGFVSAIQDLRSRLAKAQPAAPVAHSDAQVAQVPSAWFEEACALVDKYGTAEFNCGAHDGDPEDQAVPYHTRLLNHLNLASQPTAAIDVRDAAHSDLLNYVLQEDVQNRLTPRVIDIAYTAFMKAKAPNDEDGGASDWFTDTKPIVMKAIEKLRKDLQAEALKSAPSAQAAEVKS